MNEAFMRAAIRLSREKMRANCGGPFGAVIVRANEIVGQGWNCVTSRKDPTAHAEVMAIRDACAKLNTFELADCDIYTSCEPCPMCLAAIYWAGLGKIFYANTKADAASIGFDDEFIYEELAKSLADRKIAARQFLREEAQESFKEWQSKPDKIQY